MTDNTIFRDDGRCEYAIQSGAEGDGHCPAGKCSMPQPAAHLTIPGALEWDGDNGTHGADGESRAHCESEGDHEGRQLEWERCENKRLRAELECARGDMQEFKRTMDKLRAELDQAQIMERFVGYLLDNCERETIYEESLQHWLAEMLKKEKAMAASAEPAKCESCGGWGHIETEDSAHDCPECGPSVVERAVEAGVMNAPAEEDPFAVAGPYVPLTDDEIEAFETMGSGNKAKRRIAVIEAAKPKACVACDGWGTISTGIDEAPSTNCNKCGGTGKGGDDE